MPYLFTGCSENNLPTAQLQCIVNKVVAEHPVPGAILGVQSGREVWVGAAGMADIALGAPMTPCMQVRLASVTKPLTAVLAMTLVDEGVILLDHSVEMYLPGIVPQGEEMTLRMLLNHSAGVANHTECKEFWNEVYTHPARQWGGQDILSLSIPYTPEFLPGAKHSYTNTGYYLLGMVMESATGKDISTLFQERIAGPASLEHTAITRQGTFQGRLENGYAWVFTSDTVEATRDWNFSWDWTAGAGVSTAADILLLTDQLFNGRLLSPDSVNLMISPDSFAPGSSYGLGIGVFAADDPANPFGLTLIGHSGDNPGTATKWYYLPDYEVTIFAAVNRNDIPEGPEQEPLVNGSQITLDMIKQVINAVTDR